VVEAYKRDKTKQCFFKPTGAVVYDRRILSFKGLEFASLLTLEGRLTVPMQMSEYQRLRFGHGHGQADLVLVDGIFLVRRQAVEVEVGQRQAVWVGVGVIGHGGYRQDSRGPIEAQKRTVHASYIV